MNSLDYYKIEELLTDEERAARDRAMQFVQKEVLSEVVPCHRAAKFPDHLIPRMGALLAWIGIWRACWLLRANGTWARFRSWWNGNPRHTRRRALHFERQQMLDRQCIY